MPEDETPDAVPTKPNGRKVWTQAVLAGLVGLGFFGMFAALLVVPLPEGSKEALMLMVGALIGSFTTVMGYYFGSSLGSKTKEDVLSSISKGGTQ